MTVLILCQDVIGHHMAGPGIRYWEMARNVSSLHPVILLSPEPITLDAPNVTCGTYRWGDFSTLEPWLKRADRIIVNPTMFFSFPDLATVALPMAIDVYDPTILENLEWFRHEPMTERERYNASDVAMFKTAFECGDFFACATERQRDLYLGALMVSGRITPSAIEHDPDLRQLIDVVSFGLDATPPVRGNPVLRGVHSSIPSDACIFLWTGGLWEWLDPLLAIEALPAVLAEQPHVRLVFLAGKRPGSSSFPMKMPEMARRRAAELGLLGKQVIFYDEWVAYAERGTVLLEADVALSLHRNHLETQFAAVRSRFLDHLWAGLPSLVSDGDAAARLVNEHALGQVVPAGDLTALTAAMIELSHNASQRATYAANAQAVAVDWRWDRTLAPLREWLARPTDKQRRAATISATSLPGHLIAGIPQPSITGDHLSQLGALIAQSEQHWDLRTIKAQGMRQNLALQGFQRLLGPLVDQQTKSNAVLVHLLYWLMEFSERSMQTHLEQQLGLAEIEDRLLKLQSLIVSTSLDADAAQRTLNTDVDTVRQFYDHLSTIVEALNRRLESDAEQLTAVLANLATENTDEHHHPSVEP